MMKNDMDTTQRSISVAVRSMMDKVGHARAERLNEEFFHHFYFEAFLNSTETVTCIYDVVGGRMAHASKNVEDLTEIGLRAYLSDWPHIIDGLVPAAYRAEVFQVLSVGFPQFAQDFLDAQGQGVRVFNFIMPFEKLHSRQLTWIHQRMVPIKWTAKGTLLACFVYTTNITHLPFDKRVVHYLSSLSDNKAVVHLLETEAYLKKVSLNKMDVSILRLLSEGRSREEIADALNRSPHTIDKRRKAMTQKVGVRSTQELLRLAAQYNLV